MIQHFLAREIGSGRRLPGGAIDGKRPVGVDTLPVGTQWLNYRYGHDGLHIVRLDAPDSVLTAYAALPDVLPLPRDLSELLQVGQLGPARFVCDAYGVPRHWLAAGLTWDEVLRRLFRVFSLAQRLRGVSKRGLAAHMAGGVSLGTTWQDTPPALRNGLMDAADSFTALSGGMLDRASLLPTTTLGEVLYEVGRSWQREPWEIDPPLGPGTVSDDFERGTLGGNWTAGPGSFDDMTITGSSDCAPSNTTVDCACYWSAHPWSASQTSEGLLADATIYPGVLVRCASDGDTYLWVLAGADSAQFYEVANGLTFTALGAAMTTSVWNSGVLMKVEIVGTTLTGYHDGTSQGTRSDSVLTSGSAGLHGFGRTSAMWESWEGTGEVGAEPDAKFRPRTLRPRGFAPGIAR